MMTAWESATKIWTLKPVLIIHLIVIINLAITSLPHFLPLQYDLDLNFGNLIREEICRKPIAKLIC